MEKIKVNKAKLIEVLQENRAKHRAIFEKAFEGYREKAIQLLTERLDALRAGKHQAVYFNLTMPTDQTRDYDRAIKMMEMSVEDTITLSEADFQQYVQDNWRWKDAWIGNSKNYTHIPDDDEAADA